METRLRWSVLGIVIAALVVIVFIRSTPGDRIEAAAARQHQAMQAAIVALEQARMEQVANIVATDRRLADAEAADAQPEVMALTAAEEHEQVTYGELVHLELALRTNLASGHLK